MCLERDARICTLWDFFLRVCDTRAAILISGKFSDYWPSISPFQTKIRFDMHFNGDANLHQE
jgi:hypothetical protein